MSRRDWKTSEANIIKEHGRVMCADQLAELLPDRTKNQIIAFAKRYSLPICRVNGWRPNEIAKMERMAGKYGAREIAVALNRSLRAVQSKARAIRVPLKRYGQHHHMGTIPDEKREAYWALVDGGMYKKHAAIKVGVKPSTAQQWVRPPKEQIG
jgi:hypothetical protein